MPETKRRVWNFERIAFPEVPPGVEYQVTPFGSKFIRILDELKKLQGEIEEEI